MVMKRAFMSLGAIALLSNSVEARIGKAADPAEGGAATAEGAAAAEGGAAAAEGSAAAGGDDGLTNEEIKKIEEEIKKMASDEKKKYGAHLHGLYRGLIDGATGKDAPDETAVKDMCKLIISEEHFPAIKETKECKPEHIKAITEAVKKQLTSRKAMKKAFDDAKKKMDDEKEENKKEGPKKKVLAEKVKMLKADRDFMKKEMDIAEKLKKDLEKEADAHKALDKITSKAGKSSAGGDTNWMMIGGIVVLVIVALVGVFMCFCRGGKRNSGAYESYDDESTAIASGMRVNGNSSYQSTSAA